MHVWVIQHTSYHTVLWICLPASWKSAKRLVAWRKAGAIERKRWKILRCKIQMSRRKLFIDIFAVIPKTSRTLIARHQACESTHMDGSHMVTHIRSAKKKKAKRKPTYQPDTFVLSNSDTFSCIGTRQYKWVLVAAPTPHGWLPALATFHRHWAKMSWSSVSPRNLQLRSCCLRFSCIGYYGVRARV